jgi:predicted RNA binding protein YcfA (HicA-like mRNA interferase family)
VYLSQWDKLIEAILAEDPNLRFEDLYKALVKIGYTPHQPRGGSSHYTFRKPGCTPITIPKHTPLKKVYIELVAEAVRSYLEEDQ